MKSTATHTVGNISSSHCWRELQEKTHSILIDVRSPQEWQDAGIPDLKSINKDVILLTWMFFIPNIHPNKNFIEQLEKITPNKESTELFFICKSGGRSAQAADLALSNGYKYCYNVQDGFLGSSFDSDLKPLDGWVENDLPRRAL